MLTFCQSSVPPMFPSFQMLSIFRPAAVSLRMQAGGAGAPSGSPESAAHAPSVKAAARMYPLHEDPSFR